MSRSLPEYRDDLAGFAGILRKYLGLSQRKLANYLNLDHSTIARYENETIKPPVGYLAYMVCFVWQQHQRTTTQHTKETKSFLLQEMNEAIAHNYLDEPEVQSWDELDQIADEYLAKRQASHRAADHDAASVQSQHLPALEDLKVAPAELPPLPHFYIERKAIQNDLLEKIKSEQVQILVLWGQGGAGKSTLAVWLTQTLATDLVNDNYNYP